MEIILNGIKYIEIPAKQWIEKQKESVVDMDVEEHLDCAMYIYDTVFYKGNPCALF